MIISRTSEDTTHSSVVNALKAPEETRWPLLDASARCMILRWDSTEFSGTAEACFGKVRER